MSQTPGSLPPRRSLRSILPAVALPRLLNVAEAMEDSVQLDSAGQPPTTQLAPGRPPRRLSPAEILLANPATVSRADSQRDGRCRTELCRIEAYVEARRASTPRPADQAEAGR